MKALNKMQEKPKWKVNNKKMKNEKHKAKEMTKSMNVPLFSSCQIEW